LTCTNEIKKGLYPTIPAAAGNEQDCLHHEILVVFLITKSRAGKSGRQDTHRASQAGWQGEDDVDLQLNLKCKAINA